jgi:hypothetical protein
MKNPKTLAVIFSGLLAFGIQGSAQTMFQVTFKGTIQTTNGAGAIVSQKLSDQNYVQDAITALGTTNSGKNSGLTLVYVQNASTDPGITGDFIEVIEGTNNTPVYTNLLFLYGASFPPALTNSAGSAYVAGAGVVPLPLAGSGDSLGGATINERTMTKKILINGSFNYTSLRSAGSTNNDAVRFYSGTFNVGKPISP